MNCYYHEHEQAVGICQDCGRGLCKQCLDKFTTPICESCNTKRWENVKKNAGHELLMMLLFAIIGAALYIGNTPNLEFPGLILFPLAMAGTYAGWKCLDCITSKFFLFLPIGSLVTYIFIKALISLLISYPALLYRLFKDIRYIMLAKKNENTL